MTTDELRAQARELDPQESAYYERMGEDGVLASLETIWGHGLADEVCGSTTEGAGHVYRVDRWVVITNTQGDHDVETYDSAEQAERAFAEWREEVDRPDVESPFFSLGLPPQSHDDSSEEPS